MTTPGELNSKLDRLMAGVTGKALEAAMHKAGKKGKGLADKAVAADIGDMSMSGWRRSKPIEIKSRYDMLGESGLMIRPARSAVGPMRVLESGRNSAAGPRMTGPRLLKSGKASKAKQKRYNGRTDGKGTWSDAEDAMNKELPDIVAKAVREQYRKLWGG